jgi:voltage-gated potassium channel Kch
LFSVLATLLGVTLIILALRDVFHQLFHPSGAGSISGALMKAVWRAFCLLARRYPSLLALAGPSALVAVIANWVVLLAGGFALVYWPRLPGGFAFAAALDPSQEGGIADALYLSLVTLATLGFGDITPTTGWLRVLTPLEALLGFGLLTAALSWVISVYPVLRRRRSLAREVTLLRDFEPEAGDALGGMGAEAAERLLKDLTAQLVSIQSDVVQFPITYYFHNTQEKFSLPLAMPYLFRLAEQGNGADHAPQVRRRAAMLGAALEDFSTTITSSFLAMTAAPAEEVLHAYARDHLHDLPKDKDSG